MWWFQEGLCILPVALVLWTTATFIFDYITAVVLRHVDPLVPYISDTGTVAPERCVFGIMLDVSAFLGVATVYVRYKQVQALTDEEESKLHKLNVLGLVLGWTSSFGMCIVANFQKTTLFFMHLVGAILTLGVGALYILVQTLVSLYMQPHVHGKSIFWVRLSIGVWTFASIISTVCLEWTWPINCTGYLERRLVALFCVCVWCVTVMFVAGLHPHIISTISEWSLALSFVSYFLTYIRDFQKITLRAEADLRSNHMYDSPLYSITTPLNQSETSPLLAEGI
ncbi:DNA damage-regulated autophagy modulator protein 2-like isoform X1 [Oncorhynchus masou masou]|uniref:DNA damage-regulated autophagy modulator protein 2-like isoform X1 n=1 Tax=Oncorhynchus masou masou TaxID=90313 RepID=UPI00318325C3